jgi:hypothetical protein
MNVTKQASKMPKKSAEYIMLMDGDLISRQNITTNYLNVEPRRIGLAV